MSENTEQTATPPEIQRLAENANDQCLQQEIESSPTKEDRDNFVLVFCNSAHPRSFTLGGNVTDRKVTIQGQWKHSDFGNGSILSVYKQSENRPIAGGRYGVTEVPKEDWEQVEKLYGKMPEFENGMIFAAPSIEEGKNRARAHSHLRHGLEAASKEVPGGTKKFQDEGEK